MGYADDGSTKSSKQVITNGFWDNWFVSANLTGKSFYSDEEVTELKSKLSGNPFNSFRTSLGFSASIGKWFNQDLGLRTKFTGLWGKNVISDNSSTNAIKYWNIQEQVLFNIHNLLFGYKDNRLWNLIPYAGVGVLRNCSDNQYAHGLSVGLMNTWSLTKRIDFNFDCGFFISDDDTDDEYTKESIDYALSLSSSDRAYYVEAGLIFHLGKNKWKKVSEYETALSDYRSQIDELNNSLIIAQNENEKLKDTLSNIPQKVEQKIVVKKEFITAPVSVFFNIGSHEIASVKELQNVNELVKVAKDNNARISIEGYADSKTGSAEYNKKLSLKRAQTIADEIKKMGFDANMINIVEKGGVDDWAPNTLNRRVIVTIKREEK